MPIRTLGLLAGGLLAIVLTVPAGALAGPAVSVRVEGQSKTLVDAKVTLPDTPTGASQAACGAPSPSAAFEALDAATGGDWSRSAFFDTILGEKHDFGAMDYWAVWIGRGGGFLYGSGVCDDVLQAGDELLAIVDVFTSDSTVFPLALRAPASVRPGEAFTVRVDEYRPDNGSPGTGVAAPADGIEVAGGGSSATTSGGQASLTLTQPGLTTLSAVGPGTRARPVSVCVTDGGDGHCGTPICLTGGSAGYCGTTPPPGPPPAPGRPHRSPAAAPDRSPALGRIAGIRPQQRYGRARGRACFAAQSMPIPRGSGRSACG